LLILGKRQNIKRCDFENSKCSFSDQKKQKQKQKKKKKKKKDEKKISLGQVEAKKSQRKDNLKRC